MTSRAQAFCDRLLRSGSASESSPYISSIASDRIASPPCGVTNRCCMSSRIVVRAEPKGCTGSWDIVGFVCKDKLDDACATKCDESLHFRSSWIRL